MNLLVFQTESKTFVFLDRDVNRNFWSFWRFRTPELLQALRFLIFLKLETFGAVKMVFKLLFSTIVLKKPYPRFQSGSKMFFFDTADKKLGLKLR